jgi:hydrogenase assembly chaperone HypC/HupF
MCMTIPGRVEAIGAGTAQVELEGRLRQVTTLLHPEVQVGDWVIVTAGTILERLDPAEAAFIRAEIERAAAAEDAEADEAAR